MLFASFFTSLLYISTVYSYSRVLTHRNLISKASLYSTEPNPAPENAVVPKTKGFGAPKKVESPVEEKDAGTKTYEKQAKRGVPEYNIFLRPTNGTDGDWVPVGSMTIPRDTTVAKAVFEVEEELLKGTFKLYPKLKAFYDVRKDKEGIFEYGYCLKAFPDEPIRTLQKEVVAEGGNFILNW